jgi:hypothetical protein
MAKAPTEIRSLARAHTESAIRVLAGIMNETRAPAAARVSAAQALLDRGWGKADQKLTLDRRSVSELSDAELAERLAELTAAVGDSAEDDPPPVDPTQLN